MGGVSPATPDIIELNAAIGPGVVEVWAAGGVADFGVPPADEPPKCLSKKLNTWETPWMALLTSPTVLVSCSIVDGLGVVPTFGVGTGVDSTVSGGVTFGVGNGGGSARRVAASRSDGNGGGRRRSMIDTPIVIVSHSIS